MQNETVEIVFFRLADGAGDDEFLEAAAGVDSWLSQTSGFRSRALFTDGDGNWVDTVRWDSKEAALAAAEAIMQEPEGLAFGSKINPDTIFMYHMNSVHEVA